MEIVMTKDYDAQLTRWTISASLPGRYGTLAAGGTIYGDTKGRFEDGDYVFTSPIQEFDIANMIIVTKNTRYKLV